MEPSPIRLLHLSSAQTWRGGEQQIAYLYEVLAARGHQQWILCVKGSAMAQYCQKQGIAYEVYRKGFSVNPLVAYHIHRLCQREQIQLIHIHDSHAHSFACIASSLFGLTIPMVLSRRVDFPVRPNALSKWKYNHSQIKAILCVSDFVRQVTAPAISQKERLRVVHDGIDLSRFQEQVRGILRKDFGLNPDWPIIANIAAIAPHKDYFTFVDTAACLLQQGRQAHFLIIGGDGGERVVIEDYIREKGLEQAILLTGFRNDIPQILPEIDIFLFTSKTEGLGSSLLDGLASGRLIVSTAAGGIPEIIEDGKNGLLAAVGDSKKLASQLIRLLDDANLSVQLSKRAKQSAQVFSKEVMADRSLAIYREVLTQ